MTYDDVKSSILSRKRKRRGGNSKEGDGEIIILIIMLFRDKGVFFIVWHDSADGVLGEAN